MSNYILNVNERVAHRRAGLTESCNTDDIVRRRNSDQIPKGYRECEHCRGGNSAERFVQQQEDLR